MSARIGSLFSGYGGLDSGIASVLGGETAWVSDIDPGAVRILTHRLPAAPNLGDITAVDWSQVEPVDIITGGFPCQDVSHAGARAGLKDGTRTGLWSVMRDAIATIRPRLVVAENVRGLLSADADSSVEPCPWCVGDADARSPMRALGAVLADLADIGYDAWWCWPTSCRHRSATPTVPCLHLRLACRLRGRGMARSVDRTSVVRRATRCCPRQ